MKLTVYHLPQCGTCKSALKWLRAKGHELNEIDIKAEPPSKEELRTLIGNSGLGLKKFLNTSGDLYREMGMKDKIPQMSEDEVLQLMSENGMLIKRPIVTDGTRVTVGFKEETYQEVWAS
ncbi:arsenate reductase family protein [Paenibacillus thermotolerans]|uniref:arsenate reductase family protein n=1 Tax=Paenibacillus thermotolerans TaxID=3027807 RepID=UPI002367EDBA|nr:MULTISPECIES: arsenate reductase family protein [unclassified Paenibacillus]